jgi:sulfonate transport system substrate-binding protein
MRRIIQRWITSAVLSVSIVAAAVSASYGQDKVVIHIADQQQVTDTFFALGLIPKQIKISDVAWRPGT